MNYEVGELIVEEWPFSPIACGRNGRSILLQKNLVGDKRQIDAVRPQMRIFQVIIAIIVVTDMRKVVIV